MNFIIRLLVSAAIAYLLSKVLSGVHLADFKSAIFFTILLAVLNTIVKPLLLLFTLPITIVTLGLWLFIVNAVIILMADKFIKGVEIDGIGWALIFSLLLSVLTSLFNGLLEKK